MTFQVSIDVICKLCLTPKHIIREGDGFVGWSSVFGILIFLD